MATKKMNVRQVDREVWWGERVQKKSGLYNDMYPICR